MIRGLVRIRVAMTLVAVALAFVAVGLQAGVQPARAEACATGYHCSTLVVKISGTGQGTVSLSGAIHCVYSAGRTTGTCSEVGNWPDNLDYITRYLTATPATGSFTCVGAPLVCSAAGKSAVTVAYEYDAQTTVEAIVFTATQRSLTVALSGAGTGHVTVGSTAIACPSKCSAAFTYGIVVTITAVADSGQFSDWTGACAGQANPCKLTMTADRSTTAEFAALDATPAPTSSPAPPAAPLSSAAASGTVTPSAAGAVPPSGSDSTPWLPIIAVGLLAVVGTNLAIFQLVRARPKG